MMRARVCEMASGSLVKLGRAVAGGRRRLGRATHDLVYDDRTMYDDVWCTVF